MKKLNLGQAIQILANVGVIAGIIFLGVELRQNNQLMDTQLQFNRLSIATGSSTLIAENPELATALAKLDGSYLHDTGADADVDSLTPGEWNQVYGYRNRVLENLQWTFNNFTDAGIGFEEPEIEEFRRLARQPSMRIVWDLRRNELDADFAAFMEDCCIDHE